MMLNYLISQDYIRAKSIHSYVQEATNTDFYQALFTDDPISVVTQYNCYFNTFIMKFPWVCQIQSIDNEQRFWISSNMKAMTAAFSLCHLRGVLLSKTTPICTLCGRFSMIIEATKATKMMTSMTKYIKLWRTKYSMHSKMYPLLQNFGENTE